MHVYEKMYRCTQNDFLTATNSSLNLIVKYLRNIITTFKIKDIQLMLIKSVHWYYKS